MKSCEILKNPKYFKFLGVFCYFSFEQQKRSQYDIRVPTYIFFKVFSYPIKLERQNALFKFQTNLLPQNHHKQQHFRKLPQPQLQLLRKTISFP